MSQKRAFSAVSGPSRIFIVRHGDREDHADPSWKATATRPNDAPLSAKGHVSAHLLGRFLAHSRGVRVKGGGDAAEEASHVGGVGELASDIVVLASPLQRTVETAHGIIYGILKECGVGGLIYNNNTGGSSVNASSPFSQPYEAASKAVDAIYADLEAQGIDVRETAINEPTPAAAGARAAGAGTALSCDASMSSSSSSSEQQPIIPIYLEPGVVEGPHWQNYDINKSKGLGNSAIRLEGCSSNNAIAVPPSAAPSDADSDHGVFRGAAFHRKYVSHLVQEHAIACPLLSIGKEEEGPKVAGSAESPTTPASPAPSPSANHHPFASPITRVRNGFAHVELGFDPSERVIVEQHHPLYVPPVSPANSAVRVVVRPVDARIEEVMANIANSPALNGKTVIIVGHGETTFLMVRALAMAEKILSPHYTSFAEAVRIPQDGLEKLMSDFSTQGGTISPSGFAIVDTVMDAYKIKFQPWHRWEIRKGTVALDCPHLTIAEKSKLY